MKALLVLGVVAGSLFSAQASAAEYWGLCQSCIGNAQSSSWLNQAANVAAANTAAVFDVITLCRDNNPSVSVVAQYDVIAAPVTSASDVAWDSSVFSDVSCADLGFE